MVSFSLIFIFWNRVGSVGDETIFYILEIGLAISEMILIWGHRPHIMKLLRRQIWHVNITRIRSCHELDGVCMNGIFAGAVWGKAIYILMGFPFSCGTHACQNYFFKNITSGIQNKTWIRHDNMKELLLIFWPMKRCLIFYLIVCSPPTMLS